MKGTAIALIIVGVYWFWVGLDDVRHNEMQGFVKIVVGVLFLPLAKYLWGKNLGWTRAQK